MSTGRSSALAALIAIGCESATGPEKPIHGPVLYDQYCARCHGPDGTGVDDQPSAKERLSDPRVMETKSDEALMGVIRAGKEPNMPGFGDQFTEAGIMVLIAHIRKFPGARLYNDHCKSCHGVDGTSPTPLGSLDTLGDAALGRMLGTGTHGQSAGPPPPDKWSSAALKMLSAYSRELARPSADGQ